MQTTSVTIENLNDLIQIHNDRIQGFERALKDIEEQDTDLKSLFSAMANQSQQLKAELATEVAALGGNIESDTSFSGSIHRAWINLKSSLGGDDRKSILASCEFGEDAILKSYRSALEDGDLPAYVREIVERQATEIKESHDQIKTLRDAEV